jgi:hypothetical protein
MSADGIGYHKCNVLLMIVNIWDDKCNVGLITLNI